MHHDISFRLHEGSRRRRRREISHSGHTHSKFEYLRKVDSPRALGSPLPAVTKPHAKRIPREAFEERERESGRKERAARDGVQGGKAGIIWRTHEKVDCGRDHLRWCLLYVFSLPSPFFPFLIKSNINIHQDYKKQCHPPTPLTCWAAAIKRIMEDYKFTIESPCERDRRRRRHKRIHLRVSHWEYILKNSISQSYQKQRVCPPSNSNLITWGTWLQKMRTRKIRNRIFIPLNSGRELHQT